jgi:tetratricopeptide (TPR) repeat protein
MTYFVEGDLDEARGRYHRALELDPKLFEAAYGLALVEQAAGHAVNALAAATAALAAPPPHSAARSETRAIADEARSQAAIVNEEDVGSAEGPVRSPHAESR